MIGQTKIIKLDGRNRPSFFNDRTDRSYEKLGETFSSQAQFSAKESIMLRPTILSLCLMFLFSAVVFAQTGPRKLLEQPIPDTPAEAKETGLGGTLTVRVGVDADGKVTFVESVYGPDDICPGVTAPDVAALRKTAASSALKSKFEPAPAATVELMDIKFPISNPTVTPAAPATIGSETAASIPQGSSATFTAVGEPLKLNSTSLPKPPYPPAARAVRASGDVNISVIVETDGSVYSARSVSGHPLLRQAARSAACSAKFRPTKLSGQPARVSGIITYNFVP